MANDLLYKIALTFIPHIGPVQAKILAAEFETAELIFRAGIERLKSIEGIGEIRARSIKQFDRFPEAEAELRFIDEHHIRPLFITDENYPRRLLNCYDSPSLLYYKGTANLNCSKIIAIVGTRHHTDYGKQVTEKLIRDLCSMNVMIVSGLAFGIDGIAHKASLKNKLATTGVLAHGLDLLYPPYHYGLALDMLKNGGLLTEFRSGTKPDKHNFPSRNRIVAGMSDAVIVIETGVKGGSMITAELANGYNKDVFAIPGRVTDSKSAGCNYLIRTNKAVLLTEAIELIELLGWEEKMEKSKVKNQKELFIELSKEEKIVIDILREKGNVHIDEINFRSNLSSSTVAAVILNLELQNVINSLPGKMYSLS